MGGLAGIFAGSGSSLLSANPQQQSGMQPGLAYAEANGTFGNAAESSLASQASSVFQNQNLAPIFSSIGTITNPSGSTGTLGSWLPYIAGGVMILAVIFIVVKK